MRPEPGGIDEFGLVDDAIDFLVSGDEAEIRLKREPLGIEPVARTTERRRDMVADSPRHVTDQRREHRLLAVEIGVEGASATLARLVIPTIELSLNPRSPNSPSAASRILRNVFSPRAVRGSLPSLASVALVSANVFVMLNCHSPRSTHHLTS